MPNEHTDHGDGLPAGVAAAAAVYAAADRLAVLEARHQNGAGDPDGARWVAAVGDAIPELLALGERGFLDPPPGGESAPRGGWWLGRCGAGVLGLRRDGRLAWRPDAVHPAEFTATLLGFGVAAFALMTLMFLVAPGPVGAGETWAARGTRASGFAGAITLALFVFVMKGAQAYLAAAKRAEDSTTAARGDRTPSGARGLLDDWVRRWRPWRPEVVSPAEVHTTVAAVIAEGRARLRERLAVLGARSNGSGEPA